MAQDFIQEHVTVYPQHQETIDTVLRLLRDCRSVLFVTGAGVSADSGIPTYRGIGGLYDVDVTEEGLPIEEIMSGGMLEEQPERTWKYLAKIAEAAKGARPNRAHEVIAEMEQRFPRVWTLTQNVDGFHRMAGSKNVIEIHGNMRTLSCTRCNRRKEIDETRPLELPPLCPGCGTIMRPDVVLFGEQLPPQALNELRRQMEVGFSLVFSIGTSSRFPYIQEPLVVARRWGAPTIEINPVETIISCDVDYRLPLGAASALDEIWRQFLKFDETEPRRSPPR